MHAIRLFVITAAFGLVAAACASTDSTSSETTTTPSTSTPSTTAVEAPTTSLPPTSTTTTSTSTTTAASQLEVFTRYEFPPGLIDAGLEQPTRLSGVLAIPEGTGPFPVAIVLHGAFPQCFDAPNEGEFLGDYLVTSPWPTNCPQYIPDFIHLEVGLAPYIEALADAGIAAVSIDLSAAYVYWAGEIDEPMAQREIVRVHLDALDRLNRGEDLGLNLATTVADRLDFERTVFAGHSRSGALVMSLAGEFDDITTVGVVAIEPADIEPQISTAVPFLNVRGACDEDVGPNAGLAVVDRMANAGSPLVVDVLVADLGHAIVNGASSGTSCEGAIDQTAAIVAVADLVASFASIASGAGDALATTSDMTVDIRTGSIIEVSAAPWTPTPADEIQLLTSSVALIDQIPADADYSLAVIVDE